MSGIISPVPAPNFLAGSPGRGFTRCTIREVRQYMGKRKACPHRTARFFYIDRCEPGSGSPAFAVSCLTRDGDRFIQLEIPELTAILKSPVCLHDARRKLLVQHPGSGFFRVRRALIEALPAQDGLTNGHHALHDYPLQGRHTMVCYQLRRVLYRPGKSVRFAPVRRLNEHLPNCASV